MFQNTVKNKFFALGFPGEFYTQTPQRTRAAILKNKDNTKKAFSGLVAKYNKANSGLAGIEQDGAVAGIIGSPKASIRPTWLSDDSIYEGQSIEIIRQGYVIVNCVFRTNASANVGDFAYFNPATGEITTFAPTQKPTNAYERLYGATVEEYNVDLAGKSDANIYQAVIYLDLAGDRTETK